MRQLLLTTMSIIVIIFIYVLLSAQQNPDNRKFYYAFSEKIYLTELPDKYLVKASSAEGVNTLISLLNTSLAKQSKDLIRQKDNCLIVEVTDTNSFIDALKRAGSKVIFTKPGYKYHKAEIFYSDEIIVEPLQGKNINDIIKKLQLPKNIIVTNKEFYSVLKVPFNIDALDLANKIQESGLAYYSHPDFFMNTESHQVIPNDTYFNNQYYLRNTGQVFNPVENHAGTAGADIKASQAWTMTTGNNATVVAVIDEGVTGNHPDLPNARQLRLNGSNFAPGQNANDPTPDGNNNHGNACAGIIAATQGNNEGISGIAPNVRIMPIKVAFGNGGTTSTGFADAIDFAWQNGASVISNSWGTGSQNPNFSPAIVAAINRAVTQGRSGLGTVVVFSASNTASHNWGVNGQVRFPSNVQINGVLTVGASDRFDMQADYSPISSGNVNNQIIDVVAPSHRAYPPEAYFPEVGGVPGEGFEVWSIDIPGNAGYNQWNDANFPRVAPAFGEIMPNFGANNLSYTSRMGGTSAACPEVVGVAALMLSVNPNLTQQQIFNLLTQAADDVGGYTYTNGWSAEMGHGRLDACEAVSLAISQISAETVQTNCNTGTITVPSLPAGTIYNWQVNGDLLIDGTLIVKNTTDNFINVTGTNGSAYVVASTSCTSLQWSAGFTPHQREIQGLYPEYICGDHVSVSVNTTAYDTYYRWYVNNILVKEGSDAYIYCTCDYQKPDARVNGENTIRVEVETDCGITSSFDAGFWMICGYYETQSNVELFPNPARDQVTINLKQINGKQTTGQLTDIREVKIMDKLGAVKKLMKYAASTKKISINVSNLPLNIYYIEVSDGRTKAKLPLSIQK